MTQAERLESMLNEVGVPNVFLGDYSNGLMQIRIGVDGDVMVFDFINDGETFSQMFYVIGDEDE